MARYYFNVRHGDQIFADAQGIDLPDLPSVWSRARDDARSIIESGQLADRAEKPWMQVEDASGAVVAVFPFSTAVHLH
jgi:hypothetical protein